jgi:hypothetical protein
LHTRGPSRGPLNLGEVDLGILALEGVEVLQQIRRLVRVELDEAVVIFLLAILIDDTA